MRKLVLQKNDFQWIDVIGPDEDELRLLAQEFGIHPILLADCLDPKHLPKLENTNNCLFAILRAYDTTATVDCQTVQQMTRKIVLLVKGNTLLTIHRTVLPFLEEFAAQIPEDIQIPSSLRLFYEVSKVAISTYDEAFLSFEERFEEHETLITSGNVNIEAFVAARQESRRLSTIKRILWHTASVFQRLPREMDQERLYAHDLVESVQSLMFFADELADDASALINLELSLYSHRNNQVIRVLTLFSVFFMPLTFIVGVYGMNFKVMPELDWKYGYAGVWIVMVLTIASIGLWFRKKRWFET